MQSWAARFSRTRRWRWVRISRRRPVSQERRFDVVVHDRQALVIDRDTGQLWAGHTHPTNGEEDFRAPKIRP